MDHSRNVSVEEVARAHILVQDGRSQREVRRILFGVSHSTMKIKC